jgi:hypothetical protein
LIEIRGKITRKLEFWGQIDKFHNQEQICKRHQTIGAQLIEIGGKMEEIQSLRVN